MECKKCGAIVLNDTGFCGKCGSQIVTESEVCAKCKKPVKKGFEFCSYCGMPQDGSVVCPSCDGIIPSGNEFCIKCGSRADGKTECKKCGALISDAYFCGHCGEPVKPNTATTKNGTQNTAQTEKKKYIRGGTIKDKKAYDIIKTWIVTGVLLLAFCLSFFAFPKIQMRMELEGEKYTIELRSNPIEALQALAGFDATEEEYMTMYYEYAAEVSEKAEDMDGGGTAKVNYNYLKLMAAEAKGIGEDSHVNVAQIAMIVAQAAVPLVLMIASFVLLILSLIRSIAVTNKGEKPNDKKDISAIAWLLGLVALLKLVGASFGGGNALMFDEDSMNLTVKSVLNSPAMAILVFSIIALVGLIAAHYVFTDAKIDILRLASQGASILLLLIVLAGVKAKAIETTIISFSTDIPNFWTIFLAIDEGGKSSNIINCLSVAVYLSIILIVAISLYKLLCSMTKPNLTSNRKRAIALTVLVVVLIVLTIVGINIANEDFEVLEFNAWLLIPAILSVISLIQTFVISIIAKQKEDKLIQL